jgi:thiol-disulfide isomerase/thioredoxin/TolA-binding protein
MRTVLLILLLVVSPVFAQTEAVYQLLRIGDKDAAQVKIAELIPAHTADVELRALQVNLLTTRNPDRAWDLAQRLRFAHPESPWAWYAVASAGAMTANPERLAAGLEAVAKMEELAPKPLPDMMVRLKVTALLRAGKNKDAAAYLGERDDALGLYLRGYIKEAAGEREAAAEFYKRAIEAAPDDVRFATPYVHMLASMKSPIAVETGRAVVEKFPRSVAAREMYWYAINSARETPAEERNAAITANMNEFLKVSDSVDALQSVSTWNRRLENKERVAEIDREIVRRFPDTPEAQFAFMRLTFSERWTPTTDPAVLAERRKTIQTFIDYPYHASLPLLGSIFHRLMELNRIDPATGDADYLNAIDAVQAYMREPHIVKTGVAEALAERGLRLETAEKLAREGFREVPKMYEAEKETMPDYENYVTGLRGWTRGVLGFVLMKRNKMEEAGRELTKAAKETPKHPIVLLRLGTWQEKKGLLDAAEMTYARGMAHEKQAESKNLPALKTLYKKRKGSEEGFEEYAANLRLAGSSDEQRQVLATRLIPAKKVANAFEMKDLDGNRISLDDVKGRVTVLNFWGIWCAPCVAEMPYVQKLHEKYANDPKVKILTINNDSDPKKVPKWMKTNGYSFPVLLDNGFIDRAKKDIAAFPTTWFLDANGRVAFVKSGSIHNLVEEFSWRIEALKATSTQ